MHPTKFKRSKTAMVTPCIFTDKVELKLYTYSLETEFCNNVQMSPEQAIYLADSLVASAKAVLDHQNWKENQANK